MGSIGDVLFTEVLEFVLYVFEAMKGVLCMLICVLDAIEVVSMLEIVIGVRCVLWMLLCMLEAEEGRILFAGGDGGNVLCAALYA